MRIALISTYEMGRQPFGLASPAAWLRAAGHDVEAIDVAKSPLQPEQMRDAQLVAFHLPMHTATRLALKLIGRVKELNPAAQLCAYGLYAPMNEGLLRAQGVTAILGGEFEQGLVDLAAGFDSPTVSLARQQFQVPDRSGLPALSKYAQLVNGGHLRVVGYTEASRGCKHLCRHCPIVPVYNGAFRVVQRDVVMADIRQQIAQGAEHITFGDPDFFNGPKHAIDIVEELHAEFPQVSYDVTIKVEHLLKHREQLPALKRTGCAFVVSAVESVDDAILARFEKNHTRADFFGAVRMMRDAGLPLSPTFVSFTPWTTLEGYRELLATLAELDLVGSVAPIQLGIRLLIPEGSKLLELEEVRGLVGPFDAERLCYPWTHPLDELCTAVQGIARRAKSREDAFAQIWRLAGLAAPRAGRASVPYLNEPWYC